MPFSPIRLVKIKKYSTYYASNVVKKQTLLCIAAYVIDPDIETEVCLCANAYIHTHTYFSAVPTDRLQAVTGQ